MNHTQFEEIRQRYPLLKKTAHLGTASTGAIPDYVYEIYQQYQQKQYYEGGSAFWDGMNSFQMIDAVKKPIAEMLGARPEWLAFGENTSLMFAQFSGGLPLSQSDNIVLTDTSFWSMAAAWDLRRQRDGVELRVARTDRGRVSIEAILRLVDQNTRVISITHVENNTGFRHDLAALGEFCRKHDILLAVDAAQSAGVMPVDVEGMGIDFLAGNNYKWMQGFCGVGYGVFAPRAFERIEPRMAGFQSGIAQGDPAELRMQLRADAKRFEYGFPNVPGIYALSKVAEAYTRLGGDNIREYVLALRERLCEMVAAQPGLYIWSDYEPRNRSQIVIVAADERYTLSSSRLSEHDVHVDVRDGAFYGASSALRVGIHYYNNESDLEALMHALKDCCK